MGRNGGWGWAEAGDGRRAAGAAAPGLAWRAPKKAGAALYAWAAGVLRRLWIVSTAMAAWRSSRLLGLPDHRQAALAAMQLGGQLVTAAIGAELRVLGGVSGLRLGQDRVDLRAQSGDLGFKL